MSQVGVIVRQGLAGLWRHSYSTPGKAEGRSSCRIIGLSSDARKTYLKSLEVPAKRFDCMKSSANTPDRWKALIQANELALTRATCEEVFHGMCRLLSKVVPYHRAGLTLYDPDHDNLKIAVLYGPYENSAFRIGDLLDRNASQNGWTFEHQSRTIRHNLPEDARFASERQTANEGFRSLCSVPLVVRGDSIGVVTVVGARRSQFSRRHAEFLQQMSNQIALAIKSFIPHCPIHTTTKVVCPRCIGAAGGKATVLKHRAELPLWGRKGGSSRRTLDLKQ
jgi:transcriptional regulator with GAF, ATPase, and Fis domain